MTMLQWFLGVSGHSGRTGGAVYLLRARVARQVVRRVLRRGGARPAVARPVGRRPARAELRQLRALARLPRPHAGGHSPHCTQTK